ncbi:MAG: hypothetical protein AB8B66_02580 [Rickettsiaceae bacterium]
MTEEHEYCCDYMDHALSNRQGDLVDYQPDTRSYSIRYYRKNKFTGMRKDLWYCPWCGTKLPEDLDEKMEEVLEKEYDLTEKDWSRMDWNDDIHLPDEFKTDEWWKKRGL